MFVEITDYKYWLHLLLIAAGVYYLVPDGFIYLFLGLAVFDISIHQLLRLR